MRSLTQIAAPSLLAFSTACGPPPAAAPAPVAAAAMTDAGASDTVVSATMLRVLAETADQFRTGAPVFLVAAFRFPHPVLGGFPSRAAADSALTSADSGYGIFGPYLTRADAFSDSAERVLSVRLEVQRAGGTEAIDVDPEVVDALFFSMSAYDKFVVPYYTRVYGAEYALLQRLAFKRKRPPGHCLSRMCLVMEDGEVEVYPTDSLPPP